MATELSAFQQRLFSLSSLFRPLQLQRTTHKILLVLLPLATAVAVVFAYRNEATQAEAIWAGVLGLVGGYGVWALSREIVSEDNFIILLAVPAAVWTIVEGRELNLWLLFGALAMTRMVSRSVGHATLIDSVIVCVLTITTTFLTETVLFWFVGMLAFLLDAHTKDGNKRQWIFALLCAAGGSYFMSTNWPVVRELGFATLPPWTRWLLILLGATLVMSWFALSKNATSSSTSEPISRGRLRAAALVAILCTFAPLFRGYLGILTTGFLWMAVTTSSVAFLFRAGQMILGRAQKN